MKRAIQITIKYHLKKQTLSDLKKDLKEIGITIDTQTKDILKDTMRGLDDIKDGIKEKYGKLSTGNVFCTAVSPMSPIS